MAREPFLLAIMGPTGSGKTPLAEKMAAEHNAVLLNADAFQVYRGMDVGTAKPTNKDRYRLLDLKNPDDLFGLGEWTSLASDEILSSVHGGHSVIVVGGTGLYVRALFEGYTDMLPSPDPELRAALEVRQAKEGLPALAADLMQRAPEVAARTDLQNPARVRRALERLDTPQASLRIELPPIRKLKVAIDVETAGLNDRIATRIDGMVQNGWIPEIESLRAAGYRPHHPGFRALGYQSFWKVMEGEIGLDEAIATTIADTRRYAKRQRTWLRSEPRLTVFDVDLTASDPLGDVAERVNTLIDLKD